MSMGGEVRVAAMERRLRDAFLAAAQTVSADSIGDLPRLAGGGPDGGAAFQGDTPPDPAGEWSDVTVEWVPRAPRFGERVLVPLASAAAVALIAVTMTVIVPALTSGGRTAAADGARPLSYNRALGGAAPRFFVGIRRPRTSVPRPAAATLAVYSAITGKVVARLNPPGPGRWFQAVAALGSDRTFVAAASPGQGSAACHTWFYRFSLSPLGQPVSLAQLAVPEVAGELAYTSSLTASANGRVVAYATRNCTTEVSGQLGVIDLATKKVTAWGTLYPASPRNLSLSANGAVLSLAANPSPRREPRPGNPGADTAWTVLTRSAPGPLAAVYRKVLYASGGVHAAVLSPTASVLFALTATTARIGGKPGASEALGAYDAATGRQLRLVRKLGGGSYPPGIAANVSGRYALVYMLDLHAVQELNLLTGQLRTVPVAGAASPVGAAW
jgi:hypothetical protein